MTLDVGGVVGCGLGRPIISKVSMPATLTTPLEHHGTGYVIFS